MVVGLGGAALPPRPAKPTQWQRLSDTSCLARVQSNSHLVSVHQEACPATAGTHTAVHSAAADDVATPAGDPPQPQPACSDQSNVLGSSAPAVHHVQQDVQQPPFPQWWQHPQHQAQLQHPHRQQFDWQWHSHLQQHAGVPAPAQQEQHLSSHPHFIYQQPQSPCSFQQQQEHLQQGIASSSGRKRRSPSTSSTRLSPLLQESASELGGSEHHSDFQQGRSRHPAGTAAATDSAGAARASRRRRATTSPAAGGGSQHNGSSSRGNAAAPGAKRRKPAGAAAGSRGTKKGSAHIAEYADILHRVVEVPGPVFYVDTPGQVYIGQVRKLEPWRKVPSVEVQFRDDGSKYWFPVDDVRAWMAAMVRKGTWELYNPGAPIPRPSQQAGAEHGAAEAAAVTEDDAKEAAQVLQNLSVSLGSGRRAGLAGQAHAQAGAEPDLSSGRQPQAATQPAVAVDADAQALANGAICAEPGVQLQQPIGSELNRAGALDIMASAAGFKACTSPR